LADPRDFLERWSRLKRRARSAPEAPPPEPTPPAAAPAAEPPPAEAPELPPIESLTRDSDFTPFLRPGVPEELRRQALQALYRSDPVFANLDGLLDYGEDFGEAFRTAGVVATVYRVLQGMPGGEEEKGAAPSAADAESMGPETDRPPAGSVPPLAASDDAAAAKPSPSEAAAVAATPSPMDDTGEVVID
jgi:hypothetical protein